MSYVEENLLPDEVVLYRAPIHWVVYLPGLLFIIGSFFFYALKWVAIAIFFCGIIQLVRAYVFVMNTEFAVTNMRIMAKTGWMARRTIEIRHEKVEGLNLVQTAWGRMFDYGTLILNGVGSGHTYIPNIDKPLEFRKRALEAIEESKKREND